jgi:signal peptidase I
MAVSLPGVIWDLSMARDAEQRGPVQSWLQLAWLLLLVSLIALGVFWKWYGFTEALLIATLVTGLVYAYEKRFFIPAGGLEPGWLDLGRSFFPIILMVFLVRSFVVEPFKIPSGSMIPTLKIGDFILVNKFAYGLRAPVTNRVVIPVGHPERGDVMVFRYPVDPSTDYIKRVVGLPGDTVRYDAKRLTINGAPVAVDPVSAELARGLEEFPTSERFLETLGSHHHVIQIRKEQPTLFTSRVGRFPFRENCQYENDGFTCVVPPGHYFMMGDNRDSSSDSRYWGFVPEENIVGKAFFIWWNFSDFGRVGATIP